MFFQLPMYLFPFVSMDNRENIVHHTTVDVDRSFVWDVRTDFIM
jgi:hypothetical protein